MTSTPMATMAITAMRERLDCLLGGEDLWPGFGRGAPDPWRADCGARGGRGDGTVGRTGPAPAAAFGPGPVTPGPFAAGPFTAGPFAAGPFTAGPFTAGPFTG